MDTKTPEDYHVEDFVTDESFTNYHFCLNSADQLYWEKWVLQHPGKTAIVAEAKNILNMLSITLPATEYRQALNQIRDAIDTEDFLEKKRSIPVFRLLNRDKFPASKRRKLRLATAFGLPLLLLLSIAGYFFLQNDDIHVPVFETKSNNNETELIFTLKDGTVVTLAANSTIKYPVRFNEKERKVYLQGNARFHVAEDKNHPFKVYQDNIIATVLGTTFNVAKQEGDSVISIELLTGKLLVEAISSSGSLPRSIILEPNQRAVYALHNQSLIKETWQQNNEDGLPDFQLVFKQNSFEEIAARIKELYGITVINQSKKTNWRFTGEFRNTNAKNVVENICLIKKLNLEVRGDTFLIKNAAGIK